MNKSFRIIEKSKYFFIASCAIILAGIVLLIALGLNLGLDFTEGATLQVNLNVLSTANDQAYCDAIEDYIEEQGFEIEGTPRTTTTSDGYASFIYNLHYSYNGEVIDADAFAEQLGDEESGLISDIIAYVNANEGNFITAEAEGDYITKDGGITSSYTSPDATKSLTRKAFIAIAIAIVAMLIYIAIRFKVTSGIAAVIVLCHDVFVMITLTTLFQITVNTTFIAAVITVIGYSINATIIVFDRIKENLAKHPELTDAQVANRSIAETVRRTIFTSITTLVMIALIAILGVSTIQEFALPIIFGLLSGVYSAILLSGCVWVVVRKVAKKIVKGKKQGYEKYAKQKEVKEA